MARSFGIVLALFALVTAAWAQEAPRVLPGATQQPRERPRRENPATSIQEFVRIEGYNGVLLRGLGIVTGLRGTGDSGQELLLARPLAQLYANSGNPLPDLKELAKAKSAAIVTLYTDVPEGGARVGDRLDVYVQVSHSAASLKGGVLVISPLVGPSPGDPPFGFGFGPIVIEDPDTPTVGVIRGGLQIIRDIRPSRRITDSFNLIVRPHFRSWATTRMLASEINGITADLENSESAEPVASAVDDALVRVVIPVQERGNPANFIANVLTKRFSPSLLDLPAMVVVNERTGSIIVTADVEISAVTVGNDMLVVTTTTPPPVPSPADPLVSRDNWTEFGSTASGAERARLADLLEAFKRLNVPVREQISILSQINQTGRLHARFIRE